MKKQYLWLIIILFCLCGCAQTFPLDEEIKEEEQLPAVEERIILGDEQFAEYLPYLTDKRVALFSNQSGIVGNVVSAEAENDLTPFGYDDEGNEVIYGEHILDALIGKGVDVTCVFSPEHGFRGTADAGSDIADMTDPKTGIEIISLYDDGIYDSIQNIMAKFDVLVVDIQDVGLRYYTYYITLYQLLDECAAYDKSVIILDRPNPNGFYVDGPLLEEEYHSPIGLLPLPIVHGLSLGELFRMANGEGWFTSGKNSLDLTVIPCRNYTHQTLSRLIMRPSPNLKDMRAVYLYPSTCFFEDTLISVGRGTEYPFEIYGSPYLKDLADNVFTFIPQSMEGASYPVFEDEVCYGQDLRNLSLSKILDAGIDLTYLIKAYWQFHEAYPDLSFFGEDDRYGHYWIDYLSGSSALRTMIIEGKSAEEIKETWQDDIASFLKQRKPYLLYEE